MPYFRRSLSVRNAPGVRLQRSQRSLLATFALGATLWLVGGCNPPASPGPRFLRQIEWAGRGTWIKADTHIHTQFSDGAHTVSEVAAKAAAFGCDVLAVTDHADRGLAAGTHEYIEAIAAARREFPELTILAGIEWNVPPWDGEEHVTVLLPPAPGEGLRLADFKARFDDLGREEHDPALADEGFEWLAGLATDGAPPVAIYEHPARKRKRAAQIAGDLRRWRAVNDVLVGFSGAPGHQTLKPLGAYKGALKPIDRWDPAAAVVGGAWDRLLQQGIDVWAALAASDFHDDRRGGLGDYWPGQFSETWLYAPERSAAGALRALRAGAFFGVHGRIAREVELRVAVAGLPRPAVAGEAIEVSPGTELAVELSMSVPDSDWAGQANRIDEIELIGVTATGAELIAACAPEPGGRTRWKSIATPAEGIVLRARGRRIVDEDPDLMFYTNPIRVTTNAGAANRSAAPGADRNAASDADRGTPGAPGSKSRPDLSLLRFSLRPVALVNIGAAAVLSALLLLLSAAWRQSLRGAGASGPAQESAHYGQSAYGGAVEGVPRRRHFSLAWLGFIAFAVYGSWVPLDFRSLPWAEAATRFREVLDSQPLMGSRTDWAANFSLALPIGFCGLAACISGRRGWLVKTAAALAMACFCALLSAAIEFSQFWFPGRTPSLNDIVAQTIGGAAGVALWLLIGDRFACWLGSFAARRASRQQFDWLLQAYLLGLILYSLFPLDLTINPGELWQKYREGKFQFVPFASAKFTAEGCFALVGDVLLFVPVGMLAVTAFSGPSRSVRSLFHSLLLGFAVPAGIEIAQAFVYSRYTDATELVTAGAGLLWGAAWRRRRLARAGDASQSPSARRRMLAIHFLAFAAYMVFLFAFFVAPFEFIHDSGRIERRWRNFFGAPLTSLYWSTEYIAVTQVLRKGLLFAPLGYLAVRMAALAQLVGRARIAALAACLGAVIGLAMAIEYVQIWRDDTTANFTDVLLCTFGAVAAMALTIRIESAPLGTNGPDSAFTSRETAARDVAAANSHLAAAGWLLLTAGLLLVGIGLGAVWSGAAWCGVAL